MAVLPVVVVDSSQPDDHKYVKYETYSGYSRLLSFSCYEGFGAALHRASLTV